MFQLDKRLQIFTYHMSDFYCRHDSGCLRFFCSEYPDIDRAGLTRLCLIINGNKTELIFSQCQPAGIPIAQFPILDNRIPGLKG